MQISLLTTSEGIFQEEFSAFGAKYGIGPDFVFFIRFFIYYLVSLPVCYFYRKFKTPFAKNLFGIFWGSVLTIFFISTDFIWLCGAIVMLYFTTKLIAPKYGWLSNIIHLSFNVMLKLRDQFSGLSGYGNDLSTFFMMFMAKSNMVGWALHDGRLKLKNEEEFNKLHDSLKDLAMTDIDFLSYLHLMLHPSPLAAGPILHPKPFVNWLNGSNYKEGHSYCSGTKHTLHCLVSSMITLTMGVIGGIFFDPAKLLETSFIDYSVLRKVFFVSISCFLVRHKYYCGWYFAEGGNSLCGLGYTGPDEKGDPTYEKSKNMHYWQVETASSARIAVGSWNFGVVNWLVYCYHHRWKNVLGPVISLFATNQISAFWHGFHFGYYFSFFNLSLASFTDSILYKLMWQRPNWFPKIVLRVFKILFYSSCFNFGMFPFAVLEFDKCKYFFTIAGKYFLVPFYLYATFLVISFMIIGDKRKRHEKKMKMVEEKNATENNDVKPDESIDE
eukprot:TRINITY_DN3229_c0_g1_i1.p1 TRINITY_DN3229_c0_g1~~TRINITY_DN3229_c0_g1_i1.p1  ORF type:complete len:498 (-),score=90.60 TRINITY_DN3229_c0_g1_i1:336-1829(-)